MTVEIGLGDVARDTITGLSGTVIGRHEYLNGCVRLQLQPHEIKDGRPVDTSTFDIEQLELVTRGGRFRAENSPGPGGPADDPRRPSVPPR